MYLPAAFEETRPEVLHAVIAEHPFGLWVTHGPGGLLANPLPFLLDAGGAARLGVLRGHVARANPAWRDAAAGESLVVFQGPQGYVSPAWYPSKAAHGKVVPTWNYVMVQARGRARAIEDRDWLRDLVTRLTDRHEAGRAAPWAVDDAPAPYVRSMLDAIVGIEIELTGLVGKRKLSQNRSAEDRAGVIAGLAAQAAEAGTSASAETAASMSGSMPAPAMAPASAGAPAAPPPAVPDGAEGAASRGPSGSTRPAAGSAAALAAAMSDSPEPGAIAPGRSPP